MTGIRIRGTFKISTYQCYGSGSVSFAASRIRIRSIVICMDPDPSTNKQKIEKTLVSTVLRLLNTCKSMKTVVNVPTVSNKQKFFFRLLASRKPLTKRAGSGAGSESVIQCTGPKTRLSENVTDPEHWYLPTYGTVPICLLLKSISY
jgi:hypothetical protein